jgi:hypothetical protein
MLAGDGERVSPRPVPVLRVLLLRSVVVVVVPLMRVAVAFRGAARGGRGRSDRLRSLNRRDWLLFAGCRLCIGVVGGGRQPLGGGSRFAAAVARQLSACQPALC